MLRFPGCLVLDEITYDVILRSLTVFTACELVKLRVSDEVTCGESTAFCELLFRENRVLTAELF